MVPRYSVFTVFAWVPATCHVSFGLLHDARAEGDFVSDVVQVHLSKKQIGRNQQVARSIVEEGYFVSAEWLLDAAAARAGIGLSGRLSGALLVGSFSRSSCV